MIQWKVFLTKTTNKIFARIKMKQPEKYSNFSAVSFYSFIFMRLKIYKIKIEYFLIKISNLLINLDCQTANSLISYDKMYIKMGGGQIGIKLILHLIFNSFVNCFSVSSYC